MKLSVVQEDYLKTIWQLRDKLDKVSIAAMARKLRVKSSSVLSMFSYLVKADLLSYDKSSGAVLTPEGEQIARKLIRKHRLLETFLEKVLKLEGDILHEEAEHLEHVISDQLMYYIDGYLDYPRTDPHGEEIPDLQPEAERFALSSLQVGQQFEIYALNLSVEEIEYCKKHGMIVGSRWHLQEKAPSSDAYLLSSGANYMVLSQNQAGAIEIILTQEQHH